MIRLLSALALILTLSAVIRAEEDPTPAMDYGMPGNNGGPGNDNPCGYARCSARFQCYPYRDNYGYERPLCVRTNVDCEDLTDYEYDDRRDVSDQLGPEPSSDGDRRRQDYPGICRNDYECNRNNNNDYQVPMYKCCRLRGQYDRYCVTVPTYSP